MRWQLLHRVDELQPGHKILGQSRADFPDELYGDHFPSFAITPGVLLVEICAQLSGILVQASVYERSGTVVFPILSIIERAKFFRFVRPGEQLHGRAELVQLGEDWAECRCVLRCAGERRASTRLTLTFHPEGELEEGDPQLLRSWANTELDRLSSPWRPELNT